MEPIDVTAFLPHRFPFLMVDRVLEVEAGKRAVGIKNVSYGEPYFSGHFPEKAIMPGVLVLEAMAQVTVFAAFGERPQGKIGVLAGVDEARFRRPVVPGDQLRIEAELQQMRGSIGKAKCRALVDGKLAAEAEILFALRDTGTF